MRHSIILMSALFLLFCQETQAQKQGQAFVDSLLKELPKAKGGAATLKLLNTVTDSWCEVDPVKGMESADKALSLAERLRDEPALATAMRNKARLFYMQDNVAEALPLYQKALVTDQKISNKKGVNKTLIGIGNCYHFLGEHGRALKCFEQALSFYKAENDVKAIASCFNNIASVYQALADYSKALSYYRQALNTNISLGDKRGRSKSLQGLANIYWAQSDYPKALDHHQQALDINKKLDDKKGIANELYNIGLIYDDWAIYSKALQYYQQAQLIFEQVNSKSGVADCFNCIGIIYRKLGDYSKAIEYFQKAAAYNKVTGAKKALAATLGNIGGTYVLMFDSGKALNYTKQSLALYKETASKEGVASVMADLGALYYHYSNYPLALRYYKLAEKQSSGLGRTDELAQLYNNLGQTYMELGDYGTALDFADRSLKLATELHAREIQRDALLNLSIIFESQKNYEKSLSSFYQYFLMRDSIDDVDKEKELTRMSMQFDFDKKTLADSLKNNEAAKLARVELQKQRAYTYAGAVSIAFLLLAGTIFFYRFRDRKRLERKQAVLDERLRLSRDLHDDIGSTLSSINLYTEVATGKLKRQQLRETAEVLDKMGAASRLMSERMSDIVWSIHPESDKLQNITDRMKSFATLMLNGSDVELRFEIQGEIDKMVLDAERRKDFFLIYKEAINNVVKYADCRQVIVQVQLDNGRLSLRIEDDGRGFDPEHTNPTLSGNGLKNMRERAARLKGIFRITSIPLKGTVVELAVML